MLKCRFSTKGVWFKLDMNNFCSKCVCMIPMFLGIRCICAVHCIWLMGTRDPQSTWAEDHNKDGLCVSARKAGNERVPRPGGCSSSARWNDAMIDALNFHSGDPRLVTRILKVALEQISESYKGLNANHAGGFQRCPPLFLASISHLPVRLLLQLNDQPRCAILSKFCFHSRSSYTNIFRTIDLLSQKVSTLTWPLRTLWPPGPNLSSQQHLVAQVVLSDQFE